MEEKGSKLNERLGDQKISDELRQAILPYADNESLVITTPDVAAVIDARSEWGSSGGIGYYDQIRVFCGSQMQMEEWQWRDRYFADRDKPGNRIDSIGKVNVSEENGKTNVEVELVNMRHGNRTATFTFNSPRMAIVRTLSTKERTAFITAVENEMARVMADLDRRWECKPQMLASYPANMTMPTGTPTFVPYRRPSIKQKELRAEIGVATFVTEEQIDHSESDGQIRYELYVLTAGGGKAECKAENHGYRREKGAFLTILEVEPHRIVINTKNGKSTISLI